VRAGLVHANFALATNVWRVGTFVNVNAPRRIRLVHSLVAPVAVLLAVVGAVASASEARRIAADALMPAYCVLAEFSRHASVLVRALVYIYTLKTYYLMLWIVHVFWKRQKNSTILLTIAKFSFGIILPARVAFNTLIDLRASTLFARIVTTLNSNYTKIRNLKIIYKAMLI
jgi:hypothetical protein